MSIVFFFPVFILFFILMTLFSGFKLQSKAAFMNGFPIMHQFKMGCYGNNMDLIQEPPLERVKPEQLKALE